MPRYTYAIGPDGPIVPVLIGVDGPASATLIAAGVPIPALFHAKAMIDTGSNITCVAAALLRSFQLVPTTGLQTTTASGKSPVRVFTISLSIVPPASANGPLLTEPTLIVMELIHAPDDCDVLIGRDILNRYEIHYDGPGGLLHVLF